MLSDRRGANPQANESGFSLLELLVAMVVTLIVTGAIYGLLASGQTAFRREPALTERQQNIRAAMEMMQADVNIAGNQLPPFIQAFVRGDGANQGAPLLYNAGPGPAPGLNSDFLEIYGNDGYCPQVPVDPNATGSGGVNGANVFTLQRFPSCYQLPAMVAVVGLSGHYDIEKAEWPGGGGTGPSADHINFPSGKQPPQVGSCNPAPGPNQCPPGDAQYLTPIQVVRYEIAPDPADGMLSLWRSNTGGVQVVGGSAGVGYVSASANPNTNGGWRLVARGIENLKVNYTMADGRVVNSPDIVASPTYSTLVQSVRVTLTARSEQAQEAGTSTGPAGSQRAFRGDLTSVTTPRSVLVTLSGAPAPYTWR
jgi:prepilin-type N-terminal cleavage/methylation domain-containing protein